MEMCAWGWWEVKLLEMVHIFKLSLKGWKDTIKEILQRTDDIYL